MADVLVREAALALLERLAFAADREDACHRVLDELLRTEGVSKALLYLRYGGVTYADAYGFGTSVLDEANDAATPLASYLNECVDSGEPGPVGPGAPLGTGDEHFHSVPFPGPRGIPGGLAILRLDEGVDPSGLEAMLQRAGPLLVRIHALDSLQQQSERTDKRADLLSAVVDSLSDPVVLTDEQNNFLYANRRAEELFASRAQESEGRRRAIQINDLLFSSFLTQAVIGDESASRELNLVDPADGSDLLFEVISVPLPSNTQQEGSAISVLRDISDLKRAVTELEVQFNRSRIAEQAARRESERMNAIISNVSDPILVTDGDSKIVLMNQAAERLFDVRETAGESDDDLAAGRAIRANDTRFTTLMSDFLLQQDRSRRLENVILTDPETGEELPVEVVSTKIPDRHGNVSAIVSVVHDLTQMVENERLATELRVLNEGLEERIRLATEELEERNRRLEWQSRELQKASRLKSEFLASMSHELRTPINAMLGYTALVREEIFGGLNEEQHNALQRVHGASHHLLALINDILDLSKIEAGRMPVRVEEVRLDTIIRELAQTIDPMVREKGLDFTTVIADDLPLMRTDRTKVKQIVLNLLSNAVKFTEEGSVSLRARLHDDAHIMVEVSDTGIGIKAEDQPTIFADFRQVDQSHTRKYGGTGLGLSITRKLVQLMAGFIEVDSVYGEGSTFRVVLPLEVQPRGDGDFEVADEEELEEEE